MKVSSLFCLRFPVVRRCGRRVPGIKEALRALLRRKLTTLNKAANIVLPSLVEAIVTMPADETSFSRMQQVGAETQAVVRRRRRRRRRRRGGRKEADTEIHIGRQGGKS